jgi:hypothetical protein
MGQNVIWKTVSALVSATAAMRSPREHHARSVYLSSVTWTAGVAVLEAGDSQNRSVHPRSKLVFLD